MAKLRFDLDDELSFYNFESVSFEKTRNSPIVPVLRGKGASFAADNFTFNDYFELKFIIKKDYCYKLSTTDGSSKLILDKNSLCELEKIYKIYSLFRTKSLVFLENNDLFKKLFPGNEIYKIKDIKSIFRTKIDGYLQDYAKSNTNGSKEEALTNLKTGVEGIISFFKSYNAEFKTLEEMNSFFGLALKLENNEFQKTDISTLNLCGYSGATKLNLFNELSKIKAKLNLVNDKNGAGSPFVVMMNKFQISSIPSSADGYEVTMGLHYFPSLFKTLAIDEYKKAKEADTDSVNFYKKITNVVKEYFSKPLDLELHVYDINKSVLDNVYSTEIDKQQTNASIAYNFNSSTFDLNFNSQDIAQFELITYFNIAEVPIQGKSKPLKQNLGVANTTLSLRFLAKDTDQDSSFTKNFNDLQYITELEQRNIRINADFAFLNALDMKAVDLSDFHYSNDTESDGMICSVIFNCSGYGYSPSKDSETLALHSLNKKIPEDVAYSRLFKQFLESAYLDVFLKTFGDSNNPKREEAVKKIAGFENIILDEGADGPFQFKRLLESYYPLVKDKDERLQDFYDFGTVYSAIYSLYAQNTAQKTINTEKKAAAKIVNNKLSSEQKKIMSENDKIKEIKKDLLSFAKHYDKSYFHDEKQLAFKFSSGGFVLYLGFRFKSMAEETNKFPEKFAGSFFKYVDRKVQEVADKHAVAKIKGYVFMIDEINKARKAPLFDYEGFLKNYFYLPSGALKIYDDVLGKVYTNGGYDGSYYNELYSALIFYIYHACEDRDAKYDLAFFKTKHDFLTDKFGKDKAQKMIDILGVFCSNLNYNTSSSGYGTLNFEGKIPSNNFYSLIAGMSDVLYKENIKKSNELSKTVANNAEPSETPATDTSIDALTEEQSQTVYDMFLNIVNSMFPTMVNEETLIAGDDTDIIRNEFMKVVYLDYLVNFPYILKKIKDGTNYAHMMYIALGEFTARLNSDVLLSKAEKVFLENNVREDFFAKTSFTNLKNSFINIRQQINNELKPMISQLKKPPKDAGKDATYETKSSFVGNTMDSIRFMQLIKLALDNYDINPKYNPTMPFLFNCNIAVDKNKKKAFAEFLDNIGVGKIADIIPSIVDYIYGEVKTVGVTRDEFKKLYTSYIKDSQFALAFFAPLAVPYSFSASFLGGLALEAAKTFVAPFEKTYSMISHYEGNGSDTKTKKNDAKLKLKNFLAKTQRVFEFENGPVNPKTGFTPADLSIISLFDSLTNRFVLNNFNLKDVTSYCGVIHKSETSSPMNTFFKTISFVGSDKYLSDVLAGLDNVNKTLTSSFQNLENSIGSNNSSEFAKDFYGFKNLDNLYSASFCSNEHRFYDKSATEVTDSALVGTRIAMNANSGIIKSNLNNLLMHDLVYTVPTYTIFIIKNGKNLVNVNSMFEVQRIEDFYGVDKVTELSIQFSEETRVKSCFFNLIDDSTEFSNFGFETESMISKSVAEGKMTPNKQTIEIGDSICVFLGHNLEQKCVFNGVVHSVSEGKLKQICCLNYAYELSLKPFSIYRSEGEVGSGIFESIRNIFKRKLKAVKSTLGNSKKTLINPNDHIIPNKLMCKIEENSALAALSLTAPSDDDECSAYSLIFEGLANSHETLKHFRSIDDLKDKINFSDSANKINFSGIFSKASTSGQFPSNLLKNINNVDRDLNHYGVEIVGDFSQQIQDASTFIDNANKNNVE